MQWVYYLPIGQILTCPQAWNCPHLQNWCLGNVQPKKLSETFSFIKHFSFSGRGTLNWFTCYVIYLLWGQHRPQSPRWPPFTGHVIHQFILMTREWFSMLSWHYIPMSCAKLHSMKVASSFKIKPNWLSINSMATSMDNWNRICSAVQMKVTVSILLSPNASGRTRIIPK